ncbi:MAG: hypothetical protein AAGK02_04635 [Pseudomonadota bacterium]
MTDISDKVVNGIARLTGWSADFTQDLLGTAGAAALVYWLSGLVLPAIGATIAASVVSAILWRRYRRDA